MAEPLIVERVDEVAVLTLANPPVNALDLALRQALDTALDDIETDDAIRAVLIAGQGRGFSAGADISEFETGLSEPSLPSICNRVELFSKPVVAAVHGFTLAGGFELALAAHYRVAHGGTRIGLPEVQIGVLPGAGGTQRLPRLVGARQALKIMLSGGPMPLKDPAHAPLVDAFTEGDLRGAALTFCKALVSGGQGPRPTRARTDGMKDPAAYMATVRAARDGVAKSREPARGEIVGLVEMAQLLPFDVALDCEWDAFGRMMATQQSGAMRYLFFAERLAGKMPLPEGTPRPEIGKVAVLGGGLQAAHTVVACLDAGLPTAWGVRDPKNLEAGLRHLTAHYETLVIKGALSDEAAKARLAPLQTGRSDEVAQDAQLAIMAARGQAGVPLAEGAVRIAAQPGDVVGLGMRFGKPVFENRVVEILAGERLVESDLALGEAFVKRLGKVPVYVRSGNLSAAERLCEALYRAADALVEMGSEPGAVDNALAGWGWTRPPFAIRDAAGLSEAASAPRGGGGANLGQVMLDAGRTGQQKGQGFYAYLLGTRRRDPAVTELLAPHRLGDGASELDADALAWLLVAAVANEGVRMLEDRMIRRASDIDTLLAVGHGFGRWRGGPMRAVTDFGLLKLARRMEELGHPDRDFWTPRQAWLDAIKSGARLDGLAEAASAD